MADEGAFEVLAANAGAMATAAASDITNSLFTIPLIPGSIPHALAAQAFLRRYFIQGGKWQVHAGYTAIFGDIRMSLEHP